MVFRGRAFAVWLLVMAVEFVHGTVRWIFLRPRVGDFRSGQIGVFTGTVLILLVVYLCEPWLRARSHGERLQIGVLWLGLTLAFEFSFGHYVMHRSWESIGAEYDLLHGGLMPIGLLIFALSPWIASRLRGLRRRNELGKSK
jgi:hypothetical protein